MSASGFIYVPADSAATTMWSVIWSSGLEKKGTPGTVLHFETFENNAKATCMNCGTYALGPGNQANATIGRALRLFIYNLGGGQNEVNLMGTQGNVGTYSFCFAENEEAFGLVNTAQHLLFRNAKHDRVARGDQTI